MCSIDDDSVCSGIDKSLHTVESVGSHSHAGSHAQTAFAVLASHWLVLCLCDVLVCDKSHEVVVLIHHGQFLDLVFLQNLSSRGEVGLLVSSDEVLLRHHLVHLLVEMALKAKVAVGDDAHEVVVIIDDGDSSDMVFSHHVESILHGRTAANGHRVVYHTVLSTLHDSHLACLFFNRHILVDNSDTALTSDGDGHLRLGNSVHGSCYERDIQLDISGEPCLQFYRFWQYFRVSRDKQDVVKSQSVHYDFVCNK